MPNSRRRRFSVKPNFISNESSKNKSDAQSLSSHSSVNDEKFQTKPQSKATKNKGKSVNQSSIQETDHSKLQIIEENENVEVEETIMPENNLSNTSPTDVQTEEVNTVEGITTAEKEVFASSSNIDFYNILSLATNEPISLTEVDSMEIEHVSKREARPKRDKCSRQHRVKVRSPKRRISVPRDTKNIDGIENLNAGVESIDWGTETETVDRGCRIVDVCGNSPIEDHESTRSLEQMCRICHGNEALSTELGQLISTCGCRGTVGRVHVKCLERWLTESGKSRCELCGARYATKRVHKYGFVKALAMWVLNQNAKQLMVDTIGIVLMSPLAVIAAWLSGRTLAGLMTPDSHPTPWPLASTFVLACMTLVCYYCWIVSAVSRHALGWWIWYRSQYEVRLQIPGSEE